MNAMVSLVLHAHLPFVRHPENPFHLEELWFFEAMAECYLPLLGVLERLEADNIPGTLTLSVSPPLMDMMDDPLLRERFVDHLDRSLELCQNEVDRTADMPSFSPLARMYERRLEALRERFVDRYERDVLTQFARHFQTGRLELIVAAGTHAILPLLSTEEAQRAHIRLAAEHFLQRFGRAPRGMWLPECAFTPGLDALLAEVGVEFTCVETSGLQRASSRPLWGPYAPLRAPGGTAFFARDAESSARVWSATEGYPGDFLYRDFYRDIGFDLPLDYIKPYIHPDGLRLHTGLKYYRITELGEHKEPYRPELAARRALEHAAHFVHEREQQAATLSQHMPRPPVILCPFDAELFGHWWFEGPIFLEGVMRALAQSPSISAASPAQYLDAQPDIQQGIPETSSWGERGSLAVWLDSSNDWIYRHLHRAEHRMVALAQANPDARRKLKRCLDQAARELVLAQASDWAFIMKNGTTVAYAVQRTKDHLARFNQLAEMAENDRVDTRVLRRLEARDNLFAHMDYRYFS